MLAFIFILGLSLWFFFFTRAIINQWKRSRTHKEKEGPPRFVLIPESEYRRYLGAKRAEEELERWKEEYDRLYNPFTMRSHEFDLSIDEIDD